MIQTFGILSGILMLLAGIFFLLQVKKGSSTPNLTTWLITLLVSLINAVTFYKIVNENIYQGLVMFISFLTVIVIFFYALSKAKFAKLTSFDIIILGMAIFVGILWKISSDDRIANFLVQLVTFIANLATVVGLLQKRLREYYFSWLLAISAYSVAIIGFIISSNQDWLAYFGPILNGIIGNGLVLMLSSKTKN